MKKPNIIFVFADQMRSSALGCASEQVQTPNLDAFAKTGIRCKRAISNTPVCGPARATIMTGLHTLTHQLVNNDKALRTDVETLAGNLNKNGYQCGYIGKWHLGSQDRGAYINEGKERYGFDDFFAAYNCNHRYFESYYYLNNDRNPVWIDGYEPIEQTNIAISYMKEKANKKDPFCMFLSYGPPHCPYKELPKKYLDLYNEEDIVLKENAWEHADKSVIAAYYAQITALDDCFGRLLTSIEEQGIRDNTIIIFTSDHGDMMFSQNRGWKGKPWAESIMIPFLISWPGHIEEGKVCDDVISLVDLMPTLLSLTNCHIPDQVQGVDMSKLLLGDEKAVQESVFINYPVCPYKFSYREWRGIVTKRYTYARFKDQPWILYDDIEDENQMKNLVEDPSCQILVNEMDLLLEKWLDRLGDPFESTEEVCKKYYQGSIDGVMPFYENEVIKKGKEKRRRHHQSSSSS